MAKGKVGREALPPRECDCVDAKTGGRRTRYVKCTKLAKWRIRVPARGNFVSCDTHKTKGIVLGPL